MSHFAAHSSSQRLLKDFHAELQIDTKLSWGSIEPGMKASLRRQLKEACDQQSLFVGREIEPALEWRLYQLQRNRRAESRKMKPGQLFFLYLNIQAKLSTAVETVGESSSTGGKSDAGAARQSHYDPVRDL